MESVPGHISQFRCFENLRFVENPKNPAGAVFLKITHSKSAFGTAFLYITHSKSLFDTVFLHITHATSPFNNGFLLCYSFKLSL